MRKRLIARALLGLDPGRSLGGLGAAAGLRLGRCGRSIAASRSRRASASAFRGPDRLPGADDRRQHQQARRTPPPSPAPRGACGRTSAAGTSPTAGPPPPGRPPGAAGCPAPTRWPSRTAAPGPSPAPSSRSSRGRPRTSFASRAGSVPREAAIDADLLGRPQPRARLRRLLLADPPQDLGERRLAQPPRAPAACVPVKSS